MKIKVSNLGPIHGPEEFDLKPLTILIGPNNEGKTWLAYLLAGIFSPYGWERYLSEREIKNILVDYRPLEETIDKVLEVGTATLDFYKFAEEYGEHYFNTVAAHIHEWFADFMDTRRTTFNNLTLSIHLAESRKSFLDQILAVPLGMDLGLTSQDNDIDTKKPLLSINKKKGQRDLYLYTFSQEHLDQQLPRELIEQRLTFMLLLVLHGAAYSNVAVLPTERTTFITFRFNKPKHTFTEEIAKALEQALDPVSSFPRPVAAYLSSAVRAFDIGPRDITKREREAKREPKIKEYIDLSYLLEKEILGGKVDFSDPQPGPKREIVFHPQNALQPIEISLTSSMVKELTPLAFYLRYFAKPGELLVIDEPEMNLHPKAQVQIIEFLATLVNSGLRVLVTTHSPYIIDHLENLIKAAEHTDKETIRSKFYLHDCRAFIAKENVAAYLVKDGTITDALDENAEYDTFGDISDRIADIYFKL